MPRPSFQPADEQRKRVKSLSASGFRHDDIYLVIAARRNRMLKQRMQTERRDREGSLSLPHQPKGRNVWNRDGPDLLPGIVEIRRNYPHQRIVRNSRFSPNSSPEVATPYKRRSSKTILGPTPTAQETTLSSKQLLSINTWALSHLPMYRFTFRNTDHAVKRMVQSIRVYGLRIPLLVTRAGETLDQHWRAKAGRSLGFTQLPVHGTPKPVELLRRPILNHAGPGELIYDPFLGSGTSLFAAEQTALSELRKQAKLQAAEQEVSSAAA